MIEGGSVIRVLHVLGNLGRGGAETWFVHILQNINRDLFKIDVMVNTRHIGVYEQEVRRLGSRILVNESPSNPMRYSTNFLRIVRAEGPYCVLHAHLQLFTGLVMRLGYHAGIPIRIAHARNSSDGIRLTPQRVLYRALMRRWVGKYATRRLAVSRKAAEGAFGSRYGSPESCEIMSSGVDLGLFMEDVDQRDVRAKIGIRNGCRVVGHVGSFTPQKNHEFLLAVASCMMEEDEDLVFLMIGDGPLREKTVARVKDKGLESRFIILRDVHDVPRLMLGAMDLLVLPSLFEGLPRVLMEAQAAGLPCLASSVITSEARIVPGSVEFMPLEAGPRAWAEEAMQLLRQGKRGLDRVKVMAVMEKKGFTIAANRARLEQIYLQDMMTGAGISPE